MSQQGLDLIKHFEGFSPGPYHCPAGKITIGYGHVIRTDEDFNGNITPEVAEELLRKDVEWAEQCVNQFIGVPLRQQEYDALVSFVFNIGVGAFCRSSLRWKLNQGLRVEAIREFRRWNKIKGQVSEGLTNRRKAEQALFLS